jgi:hypothetical protein
VRAGFLLPYVLNISLTLVGMLIRASVHAFGCKRGFITYVIFFVLPFLAAKHSGGPKISVVYPTVSPRTARPVNIFTLHNYITEGLPSPLLVCGRGFIFHALLITGAMSTVCDAAWPWRLPNTVCGIVLATMTNVRGLTNKFLVTSFLWVFVLASHVVVLSLLIYLLVSPFTMLYVFHNIFCV